MKSLQSRSSNIRTGIRYGIHNKISSIKEYMIQIRSKKEAQPQPRVVVFVHNCRRTEAAKQRKGYEARGEEILDTVDNEKSAEEQSPIE